MNSRSDSIHVNFDHDPSLVSGVFGPQIQSCLCNKLAGCSCGLWLFQFVNNLQYFPQQLYLGQNCFENGKFYEKSSDVSASSI